MRRSYLPARSTPREDKLSEIARAPAVGYLPGVTADPETDADVPSPIDLRDPRDAHDWVREADRKRPWREQFRQTFAALLGASPLPVRRVLELGSGPGFLAERILASCTIDHYTLLDFSPPMLELSRERVGHHPAARFVLGDFKHPDWTRELDAPFDAAVAMQAVHEIRHRRHVPPLYRQIHSILRPGGLLLVCDHEPLDDSPRQIALHSTEREQHAALASAGFVGVTTELFVNRLYLCRAHRE